MSLKYGPKEIAKVVEAIDQEHETAQDAAKACLDAMEEIFEKRADFVVVGQLVANKARLRIPADDPEAIKLSLGWYSTRGDAISAASSLWASSASGDTFACWVLPVHHGTPNDLGMKRKAQYAEVAVKAKEAQSVKLKEQIEARRMAMQELADRERQLDREKGAA